MLLDLFERNELKGFTTYLPMKNATNWWEYHFEKLVVGDSHPDLKLTDADLTILGYTALYEMPQTRAHELISKYIRIKPHITDKINALYNALFKNSHVISVLYIKDKEYDYQLYNELIVKIREQIQNKGSNSKILLLSNDEIFTDLIEKEFSNIINIMGSNEDFKNGELEFLFCLTMSKTNVILGSQSSYLKVASQFNPSIPLFTVESDFLEK